MNKNYLSPEIVKNEFNRRALVRKGINKVLSSRFSEEVNEKFDLDINSLLRRYFGKKRFSNVIEVGVGIGRLAKFFADRSDRFVGIDFSQEMLAHASHDLQTEKNVELVLSDANTIEFLPHYFDLGIVSLVLKHNSDERAEVLIKKLKKWCRSVLLIEHVSGGASGSKIAIVRPESWYIKKFQPMKAATVKRFKRSEDNIIFCIFN